MADPVDLAQEHIEREAPHILAASKRPVGPAACGACHYCGEEVHGEARFCDTECRDGYEKEQTALRRGGNRTIIED